ncbi:MAG: hypothetical protein PHW50_03445 [Patescibacteria group bacterium]|nr:hypothetical protein [Patescibacteria group bacterium]
MYTDPITHISFEIELDEKQKTMLSVFDDILVDMVDYGVISKDDLLFLYSVYRTKEAKAAKHKEIALKLYEVSSRSRFKESFFNPWSSSFERFSEIKDFINDNDFWDHCHCSLRIKRGLLTAILRRYRSLKNSIHDPS